MSKTKYENAEEYYNGTRDKNSFPWSGLPKEAKLFLEKTFSKYKEEHPDEYQKDTQSTENKPDEFSGKIVFDDQNEYDRAFSNSEKQLESSAANTFGDDLDLVLTNIRFFLSEKNKSYGDSALNPKRIFSKASAREAINVRLDDKISRLINGSAVIGDNDKKDILGYLILDQIAEMRERRETENF